MNGFEFVIILVSVILGSITGWIYMLTNKKGRQRRAMDPEIKYSMNELSSIAESLTDRIDTLEAILDAEVPDWREQNEHTSK
ncbi:MAG: hypothetical protein WDZ76_00570 [Pseudohongiellaceae bacterium]